MPAVLVLADVQRAKTGPMGRGAPANNQKQRAVWYVNQAREQMRLGNFDASRDYLARAEALDQRWRDQLLEHKDAWSAIIRTAHETRLADPRDDDARGVSEQIVRQDGPTV